MRPLYVLTAAAAAAATLAATAVASPSANVRHYSWRTLTLTQRIHAQRRLIADDWRVITTWRASELNQLRLVDATIPTHPSWTATSSIVGDEPYAVHWRYLHMKWTQRELGKSLRLRERARASPAVPEGFPPHHSLWVCIQGWEGPWNDTSPPHVGGLQMHLNWYGVANAGYLSQAQQEWAAENAWKAHGYSYSFLYGEWFEWDYADGCYHA